MIILDLLNKLAVINLIIDKVVIIANGDICSYFKHFIKKFIIYTNHMCNNNNLTPTKLYPI